MRGPANLCITVALALLAACSRAPAPTNQTSVERAPASVPTPSPLSKSIPDYLGRWTGVEGMFLDVKPGGQPGAYRLTMQYDLDHRTTVDARLDGETLAFTRDGKLLTLRPTDGAATGLKYLVGKKNCLTVKEGEGYCRD